MILLDTVVVSELRKSRPDSGVLAYLQAQDTEAIFLRVLTLGEIEAGIERQRDQNPVFAGELEQ